jgi:hypothetical protein
MTAALLTIDTLDVRASVPPGPSIQRTVPFSRLRTGAQPFSHTLFGKVVRG